MAEHEPELDTSVLEGPFADDDEDEPDLEGPTEEERYALERLPPEPAQLPPGADPYTP
jgi:hypothetical protein